MPSGRVIGVDAGGTKLLAGVVDAQLVVHERVRRVWTHGDQSSDRRAVLDTMVEVVEEVRAAAPDAQGVGFGIPSLVDSEGNSTMAVHLPLEDLPFRDLMSERLGLAVSVENDANAAALVEQRYGAARGAAHVVLLTLGTGIGGGLILNGQVYRGALGTGAELGHMVLDLEGPSHPGTCPNRGCLESFVSGTAIAREGAEAGRREPGSALGREAAAGAVTGALVTELAHDGDEAALGALELVGRRLGAGLVSLVNVFNPDFVVLGGGALAAGELLLGPAREVVAERALRPSRDHVRIVPAHFGEEAGMLGAALLALEGRRG